MHFGLHIAEEISMRLDMIEAIIEKEFKGLCTTCVHVNSCSYYRNTEKAVIQCELFEVDDEVVFKQNVPIGICKTCEKAPQCRLPGRKSGTWRCDEFV